MYVENKELTVIPFGSNSEKPLKSPGLHTYCVRGSRSEGRREPVTRTLTGASLLRSQRDDRIDSSRPASGNDRCDEGNGE